MPFVKGKSGNPTGRKPGSVGDRSKDNLSRALRFVTLLESHPKFDQIMLNLEPYQIARLYKDMIEFIEPRLSRVQHTDPDGNTVQINVNVRASAQQQDSSYAGVQKEEPAIVNACNVIEDGEDKF